MLVQLKIEITNLFEPIPNAHVLYLFQEINAYIDYAAACILKSIQLGKRTLVIENDCFLRLIEVRLQPLLSASQMNKILFQNNFEFFLLSSIRKIHPSIIFLIKSIKNIFIIMPREFGLIQNGTNKPASLLSLKNLNKSKRAFKRNGRLMRMCLQPGKLDQPSKAGTSSLSRF